MKFSSNIKSAITILTIIMAMLGCSKYTDIKTQGHLIPGSFQNYRYLLNGSSFINSGSTLIDYASDDVYYIDSSSQLKSWISAGDYYAYALNSYKWSDVIYPLNGNYYQDQVWNNIYNVITYANVVITEVPSVTDSSENAKQELIAEAKVHRADAYFNLVQMYGKPYGNTSATDPGVPLVLTETTTQSLVRASVSNVYNQIIQDLKEAIPFLPKTQNLTILPTTASAFGELARTYLYMGQLDSSNLYADSALSINSHLIDLSIIDTVNASTYPIRINNPELLLGKGIAYYNISAYSPYAMRLSSSILNELGRKDLRYKYFTLGASTILYDNTDTVSRFFALDRAIGESRNTGPSVPEMILIKAEYNARNNNPSEAMNWVNKLRIKRFKSADYSPLTATDAATALKIVIEERDREFFCRSIRWWDMRRLKDDPNFSETLTRTVNGVSYTLTPTSNRYVFPISGYNIQLNPEIVPNP
ncbi:RagB/SusD family nutrient uptake outer membrane protein [Rhizosphaericola mali]|uniref:RagB/SusD family nutrient uptake outer membrane protein n=1 Tax=Rhizosphaericola mali TaxID=2545455 RepID=A0A5P2G3H7_9BACT|nr:RagB/SusD family nutrient uptake outer membrane protein [Rhizosphaericola mali]QES88360.1 RagB/SusD family nutrient uptake outer membrane protein [Rhizosphaericola mali]